MRLSNERKMAAKVRASTPKGHRGPFGGDHLPRVSAFTAENVHHGRGRQRVSCELVLPMPAQKIIASSSPTMPTGRWSITQVMKM